MTQLTIHLTLPEDMSERLRERASEAGHETIEDFVRALLMEELEFESEDFGAPEHLSIDSEQQLKAVLAARLNDPRPPIEADEAFWDSMRERARGREPGKTVE
jgi:plasmid stability protein